MNKEWTRKQKIASLVIGVVAMLFLFASLNELSVHKPISMFLYLGIAMNGFSMAMSPRALSQNVSFKGGRLNGPILFGGSAIFSVGGNVCVLIAVLSWFVGKLL